MPQVSSSLVTLLFLSHIAAQKSLVILEIQWGLSGGSYGEESAHNVWETLLDPWIGKIPEGHGYPSQYSCLAGYSPWGWKELDTSEHLIPKGLMSSWDMALTQDPGVCYHNQSLFLFVYLFLSFWFPISLVSFLFPSKSSLFLLPIPSPSVYLHHLLNEPGLLPRQEDLLASRSFCFLFRKNS